MIKKIKKDITILAVGDNSDYDTFKKFNKEKRIFAGYGFDYVAIDYQRLLEGKAPQINTDKIIVFLFFPFYYWNKYIEHKNYKGVYGNHNFQRKFLRFWDNFEKKTKRYFADKEILFINEPRLCAEYRDKFRISRRLDKFKIPQSRIYKITSIKEIKNKLAKGHQLFLKPRYGSMGKGITFLSQFDWRTNFIYKDNRIISKRSDHGWKFKDVTGQNDFLRQLLKKDILIQEAVESPIYKGNKIDIRVYTFFNKVLYIYPRRNKADRVTTNISQGGQGDPGLLKFLPVSLIKKVKREAIKVSSRLGITLAGIDIIPEHNCKDLHVIDVNLFSGFPKRRRFNITQSMAKELRRLHNKDKLHFRKSNG